MTVNQNNTAAVVTNIGDCGISNSGAEATRSSIIDGRLENDARVRLEPESMAESQQTVQESQTEESQLLATDNPCWGSPTKCSLADLLQLIDKETSILYESDSLLVLNKPPDLRMDGPYPATVHKLLTYWYPSPSVLERARHKSRATASRDGHATASTNIGTVPPRGKEDRRELDDALLDIVASLHLHSDVADCELRPCHQLDYATSGVLLVARDKSTAAHARAIWEARTAGLQKVYTAVLLGHVPNHWTAPSQKSLHSYQETRQWPVLSRAQLESALPNMEVSYRKSRRAVHKKSHANGYVPVYSLFQQWNHQEDKRQRITESKSTSSREYVRPEPSKKYKRSLNGNQSHQVLDDRGRDSTTQDAQQFWDLVWAPLQQLAPAEYQMARRLKWKDLKQLRNSQHQGPTPPPSADTMGHDCVNGVQECESTSAGRIMSFFEQATMLYNKLQHEKLAGALTLANTMDSDALSLPCVFCVESTDTNTCREETFYINVPLAQVEHDFAMRIHPDYYHKQLSIPAVDALAPMQYYDLLAGDAELDNFKPSLTKCTILHRTYLNRPVATNEPSSTLSASAGNRNEGAGLSTSDRVAVTIVQMQPLTGRRHQLRVHAAFAGHAIAGDCTYASTVAKRSDPRQPQSSSKARLEPNIQSSACKEISHHRMVVPRLCLHSTSLRVPGLVAGKEAPLSVHAASPFTWVSSSIEDGDEDSFVEISMF
jgi:23S rRNA-/tRNA-specific pseudouridylate synthase